MHSPWQPNAMLASFQFNFRETYDRQTADVKTKQKELQNMEESITQKVIEKVYLFECCVICSKQL